MDNLSDKQTRMLATINQWHNDQYRGKVPVKVHCRNVSEIVVYALTATKSIEDVELLDDIAVAALGHDLLEDTAITRDELREQYGERVLDFIEQLTNHQDDQHTAQYMEQIKLAPEAVRIIKYGDLIDNITSVNYELHLLGLEWGNNFFKPIMENTLSVLQDSEFPVYGEAAAMLGQTAQLFANLLRLKLDRSG